MARVARRIGLRDHAAERLPEDDRLHDPERLAQRPQVVAPLRERPGRRIAGHASPVAAMIEVDHLRDVGERVELGPEARMIEPRSAVHHDQRRLLAHRRTLGRKLRSGDVEKNALIADLHEHRRR